MSGGKNSQLCELAKPETTCHSWRTDFKLCTPMDVFYDTKDEEAKACAVRAWAWAGTVASQSLILPDFVLGQLHL